MKKIFFLSLIAAITFSCKEELKDITILDEDSSALTLQVLDKGDNPLPNAKVKLAQLDAGQTIPFDTEISGADGLVAFGDMLEGNYQYTVIHEGQAGVEYIVQKNFQLVGAIDKTVQVRPMSNVGELVVNLKQVGGAAIPSYSVSLLEDNGTDYSNMIHADRVTNEFKLQITDVEGIASFKFVPVNADQSDKSYILYSYSDETNGELSTPLAVKFETVSVYDVER